MKMLCQRASESRNFAAWVLKKTAFFQNDSD